jgi:hypothetical protein
VARADAGREADAVFAAEIEQAFAMTEVSCKLAGDRIERAGHRRAGRGRECPRGRNDRVGIAFLVRALRLGAEHAEVVADDPAEIPAIGMVDAGSVLEALDADIELVVDDGADIGFQIGLAVLAIAGAAIADAATAIPSAIFLILDSPLNLPARLVIPARFAGN